MSVVAASRASTPRIDAVVDGDGEDGELVPSPGTPHAARRAVQRLAEDSRPPFLAHAGEDVWACSSLVGPLGPFHRVISGPVSAAHKTDRARFPLVRDDGHAEWQGKVIIAIVLDRDDPGSGFASRDPVARSVAYPDGDLSR